MNERGQNSSLAYQRFRNLTLTAAILTFLVIVIGGIVRVTGAGGACADLISIGPCIGPLNSPVMGSAALDFLHRLATIIVTPLVLAAAFIAWNRRSEKTRVSLPILFSLAILTVQIGLGALVFSQQSQALRSWMSAMHLGLSLLVQAGLLVGAVMLFYSNYDQSVRNKKLRRISFQSPFARLSVITLGVVFLLLLSGAVVSGSQSTSACASWPLCETGLFPTDLLGWIQVIHRLFVVLAAALMSGLLVQAWRTQRTQTPVLVSATAAFVLFVSQALMGARMVAGFEMHQLVLHQATSVAVWSALVVLVTATGLAARTAAQERAEARQISGRTGLAKDLLMLTKPIVVALLLVTTYAGMVIGAQAWPALGVTFWTLLGGFLAAGGSGAINQYIDRFDDGKMQRTQKRPIPSGRLTPGEGLAFGSAAALISFFLMVAFVNFLAALLTLAGIIYYVLLYSIFLKKTTVQNIVIGGGAGAIPPLVGWAAATGHLNIPSLFLFAIVFMWTPPHFWALSIVRRKDYARAGVPMLPVVRGEKETRWQILVYTVELVLLTLLLPLFGLGGSVYLIGAAVLGAWLLGAAWKVWRQEGNKVAWKMYRYSSMYLAFLFAVLMVDRLL
jgi:protoheme IX farnesyltransferase